MTVETGVANIGAGGNDKGMGKGRSSGKENEQEEVALM